MDQTAVSNIKEGKTALGIEFGSTRIKAVLTDLSGAVLATGIYDWENSFENGIWTYSQEQILSGLKGCYSDLRNNVKKDYGTDLTTLGALGISAMMHGYLAFDKDGKLLHPFETWRNTDTGAAADELTELLNFNIPLRWSVSHLYQRILDKEEHVKNIDYVATLAAYIHYLLTGKKVDGVGDASGMFPVDSETFDYDGAMVRKFDELTAKHGFDKKLRDIFPKVLVAGDGEGAGSLTAEGAALLDESGLLKPGVPMAPPEGDAGTGMVATNAVRKFTGNTSAGTSTFAMLVMDKGLSKVHREIDMVTTPSGYPVAMAHANNGTTDINRWMELFGRVSELLGHKVDAGDVFTKLFTASLDADSDCGGCISYGYYSGEGITNVNEGRPLFVKSPDSKMTAENFVRNLIYSSLAAVKAGMDILLKEEGAKCISMTGHGGLFKTPGVAQKYLAAALNAPVTVMETASEGGAWGMALLSAFVLAPKGTALEDYLEKIFASVTSTTAEPDADDVKGFETYMSHYHSALDAEKAAIDCVKW